VFSGSTRLHHWRPAFTSSRQIGQGAKRLRSGEATDKALVAAYRKVLVTLPSTAMCNRYVSPTAGDMERYWHVGGRNPWRGTEVFPRAPGPFIRAPNDLASFRVAILCATRLDERIQEFDSAAHNQP
jgi:hypothetical protein